MLPGKDCLEILHNIGSVRRCPKYFSFFLFQIHRQTIPIIYEAAQVRQRHRNAFMGKPHILFLDAYASQGSTLLLTESLTHSLIEMEIRALISLLYSQCLKCLRLIQYLRYIQNLIYNQYIRYLKYPIYLMRNFCCLLTRLHKKHN